MCTSVLCYPTMPTQVFSIFMFIIVYVWGSPAEQGKGDSTEFHVEQSELIINPFPRRNALQTLGEEK